MPGNPQGADVPLGLSRVGDIDARLDTATELARQVEQTIITRLLTCLQNAEDAHKDILAQTAGRIGATVEGLQVKANKMAGKMVKNADRALSNAYNSAYALGASYPLQQDVIRGLETGDYLGTMLAPSYMEKSPPPATPDPNTVDPGFILPPPPPPPINPNPAGFDPILPPPPPATLPGGSGGGTPTVGGACAPNEPLIPCIDNSNTAWYDAFPTLPPTPFDVNNQPMTWPPTKSNSCPQGSTMVWRQWCVNWCQPAPPGRATFWLPEGYLPKWDHAAVNGFKVVPNAPFGYNLPSPGFIMGNPFACTYTVGGGGGGDTLPGGGGGPPATCPSDTPLDCAPGKTPSASPLGATADICAALADLMAKYGQAEVNFEALLKVAGNSGTGSLAQQINQAIYGSPEPFLAAIWGRLGKWFDGIITNATKGADCNGVALTPFAINQALMRFLDQWFAIIPPQILEAVRQASNTACQSILPTGSEADGAYLADTIDKEKWECYHKAQGEYIRDFEKIMDAKRVRPDAIQLAQLCRRGQITTDEYDKAVRASGVTHDEDKKRLWDLTQVWPGLADVVRMMVRDVFDPQVVLDADLDADFANKFQGKAKDLAAAQGIDEETMRFYWRAHWQVPSFTMLAEMVKRLRPGAVDKNLQFTEDDLKKWLKVDDWAPGLIDRMVAVTFNVVTRVDARRMFSLHTIEKQDLINYLQDEGYTQDDAQALGDFFEKQRSVQEFKSSGQPTVTTAANLFSAGIMTETEMRDYAAAIALSDDHKKLIVQGFQQKRTLKRRTIAVQNVKASYMRGLLDDGDAIAELTSKEIEAEQADELVSEWRDERESKSKIPGAAQLCKWRGMGLIDPVEQGKALYRLGYRDADISRIIGQCEIEWTEKQRKLAEAAARKAQQEIDRLQAKAEKEAKAKAKALLDALPCKPGPKPKCPPGQSVPGQTSTTTA